MKLTKQFNRQGRAAVVTAVLVTAAAVCWAQQSRSPGNAGSAAAAATAALQQQQISIEQQKLAATHQAGPPPFPLSGDTATPYIADSARIKRNDERQRRVETDTERLLNLANQLKSEVAASGAESMTPTMLHQMDEIEKLARNVKDKMRS